VRQIYPLGQAKRPTCPHCGDHLILVLPSGGDGARCSASIATVPIP
jgi:hypothetical protein